MYEKLGGSEVIDRIVDDFYKIMSTDPKAARCFATHSGRDIAESGKKLKAFLSGWLGGPPVYLETYGHPRLRMRHFPFSIGKDEADEWLYCMKEALDKNSVPEHIRNQMLAAFHQVTTMLQNKKSDES